MSQYFNYGDDFLVSHYTLSKKPNPKEFLMHSHETYELFYYISGKGVYKVEGNAYKLHSGDIAIMRPYEAHHIEINPDYPYTRFTVHFSPQLFSSLNITESLLLPFVNRESGQFNVYRQTDFKSDAYKIFLENMIADTDNRRRQLITNLLPLLNEIAIAFANKKTDSTVDSIDFKIVKYVNANLCENLSLDRICSEFYISKAQLCRIFKRATGSTVWDYITLKRLALAHEMLKSGCSPNYVYTRCGYKDYSVFFRAYRQKYGIAPSKDI